MEHGKDSLPKIESDVSCAKLKLRFRGRGSQSQYMVDAFECFLSMDYQKMKNGHGERRGSFGGLLSVFAVKNLCNEHFKSSRKQKCSHFIDTHAINKQKIVDFFQRDRHRMFTQTWIRPIFVHHCIESGLKDEILCLLSIRTSQSQHQQCGRTQRAIWRALDYCTQTNLSCWIQMVAVFVCGFFLLSRLMTVNLAVFLLRWCRRICINLYNYAKYFEACVKIANGHHGFFIMSKYHRLSWSEYVFIYSWNGAQFFFCKAIVLLESTNSAAYWKSPFAFIYLNPFIRLQYREEIIKRKLSAECWVNQLNFDWKKGNNILKKEYFL